MLTLTREQQKNWEAARRINRETRSNPTSPYTGKYVAVLQQRPIGIAEGIEELEAQLDAMGADREVTMCIEASRDYDETHFIWSVPGEALTVGGCAR